MIKDGKEVNFSEFSNGLMSVLSSSKSALKSLEDEMKSIEKEKSDMEVRLRLATNSYNDQVVRNSLYMNEFEKKKKSIQSELEKEKLETFELRRKAEIESIEVSKKLAEVIKKEEFLNSKIDEINKKGMELEIKKEKVKSFLSSF